MNTKTQRNNNFLHKKVLFYDVLIIHILKYHIFTCPNFTEQRLLFLLSYRWINILLLQQMTMIVLGPMLGSITDLLFLQLDNISLLRPMIILAPTLSSIAHLFLQLDKHPSSPADENDRSGSHSVFNSPNPLFRRELHAVLLLRSITNTFLIGKNK